MPVHDWTRVEAGVFHDFHNVWLGTLRTALNGGLLPESYYALTEQHFGRGVADVLTLQGSALPEPAAPTNQGGVALAEAPPRTRHRSVLAPAAHLRRRTLTIRHVRGHRVVALLEVVSPANKDRRETAREFVSKLTSALRTGVHVLLVDLFPPGPHDPCGFHDLLVRRWTRKKKRYTLPAAEPLTLASYKAGPSVESFQEHLAVGGTLPDMPLFFTPDRYVNVPLETAYQEAYRGVPAYWRRVLETR